MSSREDRVIVATIALFVLSLLILSYAEYAFAVDIDRPIVAYLLFAGVAVVGPQLYLAATSDDVPSRTRVRFAVLASLVLAIVFGGTSTWEERLVVAIGVGGYVAYVGYEAVAGYRSGGGSARAE
ncbi:hypothetical protein [Halovivax sp.]|uniref:hypothetical protein n=1 Tax=Halovivax sp. TaxID=1935978 RepID=UPI0025BF56F2|nr:hypothetical protein [Halovivax sp.]